MRDRRQTRKVSFELESMEERALTSSLSLAQMRQFMAFRSAVTAMRLSTIRSSSLASSRFARPNAFGSVIAPGRTSFSVTVLPRSAAAMTAAAAASTRVTAAASTDIGDVKNGPLAKAGQDLIKLYQDFLKFSGTGTFKSTNAPSIEVVGTSVRVDVRGSGSVAGLAAAMANLGMEVQSTDANTRTVEGLLPISQLPNAAQLTQVSSISPVYTMRLH